MLNIKNTVAVLLLICLSENVISQSSWTNYTPYNSGVKSTVRALESDFLNRIWLGYEWSASGLSIFDGISWITYDTTNGLSNNNVHVIFEDSNHNMWVGTEDGLCKFDGNNWVYFTTNDGLVYNYVISIYEDVDSNLWFGTVNGLSKFDGLNWTNFFISDGLANNYVFDITQDKQGNMWFSYGLSSSGVTKFDGINWITYTTSDGLISNQVNTISCDHLGNLWFGCYGFNGGISMFDGISWTSYLPGNGPACNNVWASVQDSQNNLWFSTSCHGGTSMYNYSNWTIYDTTNSEIVSNNILEIIEDNSGNIWLGGYDGISRFSPQSAKITEKSKTNKNGISIYPNPSNGKITVIGSESKESQIYIYNLIGEQVFQSENSNLKSAVADEINLNLPNGIYFYKVENDKQFMSTGKLLIE